MERAVTSPLDLGILDRNLAALRQKDQPLAERLAASNPPADLAATRDGSMNYRLTTPEGTVGWLGRTSIPAVRAEAILESFQPGTGNVFLPGIAEGTEALLLTERLGPHRAVFAWEPDPLNVRLVLSLHDFARAIEAGQLILLVCPALDLATTLTAWLERNPGHLCPERLLMWPWQTFPEVAECRSSVEQAYQLIEQTRSTQIQAARAKISAMPAPAEDDPLAVALIALHAREDTWVLTEALVSAGESMGWRMLPVVLRTPADVHPLARLRTLSTAERRPHCTILLNVSRAQLGALLPEDWPAVAWLDADTPTEFPVQLPDGDLIAATDNEVTRRLTESCPDAKVIVCPPPCLQTSPGDESERDLDVLLFADLPTLEPAAYGHQLPTYQQIWRAAVDLIQAKIETVTPDDVEGCLDFAEKRVGTRIEDAAVRQAMLDALAGPVGGAVLHQFIADVLQASGVRLAVAGQGWTGRYQHCHLGPATTLAQQQTLAARCRVWVHAALRGTVTTATLTAAGAGAVVIARRHPGDTAPGGLATLLETGRQYVPFDTATTLVREVHRLLADEPARRRISAAAAERCRCDHTPAQRLRCLVSAVTSYSRSRQTLC